MHSVTSNDHILKYQRFTLSGGKDIVIRKFKLVAKVIFIGSRSELGLGSESGS